MEDYIKKNFGGYRFNAKYPPDYKKYGDANLGYKTWNQEAFFYDFAVNFYDIGFSYNGKQYWVLTEPGYVALCDEHFNEEFRRFADANAFIEQFTIDGKPLLDLIDKLEDVDIY